MYRHRIRAFPCIASFDFRCAAVNFCLSSGLSVLAVFVSFLCAILTSAFYKYSTREEQTVPADETMFTSLGDDHDDDTRIAAASIEESLLASTSFPQPIDNDNDEELNYSPSAPSLSEIEIYAHDRAENNGDDDTERCDPFSIEIVEGSEEDIQQQQIANIYRVLNDQNLINNWSTTDFLDQLKMYGLQASDENEIEAS